ncbi:MAG: hypothetical protein ABJA35_01710, partial [Parafilimonas sp.]
VVWFIIYETIVVIVCDKKELLNGKYGLLNGIFSCMEQLLQDFLERSYNKKLRNVLIKVVCSG